ncbi:hypothetical protein LMG27177_05288 [Paraburkholderia fynbosensis]|uniref:Uncharacterized protein n=1 Tax=Paraburkholderia fynbosensis TaxID=1200993 RepID=A0A6J5GP85_9BURK|nr:hypothetical protein LMG27177_05288 [Paraburkholderia fynbosensis]
MPAALSAGARISVRVNTSGLAVSCADRKLLHPQS